MGIRKFGTSASQEVTGVEQAPMSRQAARDDGDLDQALAEENAAADSGEDRD